MDFKPLINSHEIRKYKIWKQNIIFENLTQEYLFLDHMFWLFLF